MGKPRIINWENFDSEVLKSSKPVIVDFWAEWCGPCKTLSPVIDQLALEYEDKLVFAKVDVESNPQIASFLGIRSIPTVIFFSQGLEKERLVGSYPKNQIQKIVELYAS